MKKKLLLITFLVSKFTISSIYGQSSDFLKEQLTTIQTAVISMPEIPRTASKDHAGFIIPIENEINQNGKWFINNDGKNYWVLKIQVPRAKALSVYFDKFNIASNERIHFYNEALEEKINPLTSLDNKYEQKAVSDNILGNTIIILYEGLNIENKLPFHIEGIGAIHKSSNDFGGAEACEVNINCTEGSNYQQVKKAIARILAKQGSNLGWCTGTLVNNVNQDCKPYILTANHCSDGSSNSDFTQWKFYFNYEFSGCSNSTTEPSYQLITGSQVLAQATDYGDVTSDFLLLKLTSTSFSTSNLYLAGWNAQNIPASKGACIHHPSGDVKKISTFTTQAVSDQYGTTVPNQNTHWRIKWTATTNGFGVTEGGSSGSPVLNDALEIVGTLTGGGSDCVNTFNEDYFGKVYKHFLVGKNGVTLKTYLDPSNTGTTNVSGRQYNCGSTAISKVEDTEKVTILYTSNGVVVQTKNPIKSITIFDIIGNKITVQQTNTNPLETLISLENLPRSSYIIQTHFESGETTSNLIVHK